MIIFIRTLMTEEVGIEKNKHVPPVLFEQPAGLTTSSTRNIYLPRTICGTPER